ncbi:hypothetical protein BU23DRAFT_155623 [Bimuria novae-zelandiae CBS 107.79]|uniref:Infection structure specific protein n=1 Tax=Bimuria novae-zelandiae CBS 107.79 TaxID=1447943 RepID=A0A6A5VH83_9PLEO|nr:hypothetical protein BU23DRAFT_155623 [Bimuria novae-zelandiae CBS 107.79]
MDLSLRTWPSNLPSFCKFLISISRQFNLSYILSRPDRHSLAVNMTLSLLYIALLTTSALAAPRPEVEVVQVRELVKRQDPTPSIDLGGLVSLIPTDLGTLLPSSIDLNSLLSDVGTLLPSGFSDCLPPSDLPAAPTIPADVFSALATYTDVCHKPSFTGSAGQHYSSYLSEMSKYEEDNAPKITSWINKLESDCPYASLVPTGAADLSGLLASYTLPSCASAGRPTAKETGASGGAAPTGGSKGPTGTGVGPAEATGAATQQTAFAAVAGVVAGFAGFVAVL